MKKFYLLLALLSMSFVYSQVGIGTQTPSATLDIVTTGNTSATKALEINNSSATEMVTVLNNGNVGIGTNAPTSILEVMGSNTLNAIGMGNSTLGSSFRTKISTEGSGTQDRWMKFNSDWGTITNGTRAFGFFRGTTEHLTILDNGKVGIGNASPAEILDVTGNVKFTGSLKPAGLDGTAGQVLTSAGAGVAPIWVTPAPTTTTNTLSSTGGALTSTVNGVAATLTPATGTISSTLGFDAGGVIVKQVPTAANTPNIYSADGTIAGTRAVTMGTNTLTWTSTATTQSPMAITANSLTTGTALNISTTALTTGSALNISSANGTSNANGVIKIVNTSASGAGTFATLQANSTAGSGMSILNSGNVGIGTASPLDRLHVNGDESIVNNSFKASAGTANLNFRFGGNATEITNPIASIRGVNLFGSNGPSSYDGGLSFSTLNLNSLTEKMRITNDGYVGIGTTTPNSQLEIMGSNSVNAFAIGNTTLGSSFRTKISTEGSGAEDRWMKFNSDWSTITNGTRAFGFFRGNTEHLTILDNGNIGIANTTPAGRLHLSGTAGSTLDLFVSQINNCGGLCGQGTARNIVLSNNNASNLNFASIDFVPGANPIGLSGSSISGIDRDATNNYAGIAFFTRNATNYAERLIIKSSGNVGIGIATPLHPLHMGSGAHVTTAGVWTNASDSRLKTNVTNTNYGLKEVLNLRPVQYTMKSDNSKQVGFIAQEVKQIIPEVVSGIEGNIEKGETLGLAYGNLVPVLTKAIQEQQKQIEELKAEIKALKERK